MPVTDKVVSHYFNYYIYYGLFVCFNECSFFLIKLKHHFCAAAPHLAWIELFHTKEKFNYIRPYVSLNLTCAILIGPLES